MNKFLMAVIAALSLSLVAAESDAASRMGGGKNLGRQREMMKQPAPKSPSQQAPAATPATPQPQSGMSKWLGPLAGLALGAGLASLFLNNGFAGAMGGILMILLIVAAAIFLLRMLRAKQQPRPLQYAGAPGSPGVPPSSISNHFGGGAGAGVATVANRYPPGFDADQFVHHAKLNFAQLQAANDRRDLTTMRDFMTPALYSEIAAAANARDADQKTEVVTLNADVVEVVTEGDSYIASVRFTGMLRENPDAPAEPFSEVWHLEKPVNGRTGWLISGIQQD